MDRFESIKPAEVEEPLFSPHTEDTRAGQAYLKDLIFSGEYKHPTQGFTLQMDRARMDRLCANFDKMQASGVRVPIYTTHKGGSPATLGYLSAMVRGGTPAARMLEARRAGDAAGKPLDADTMYGICDFSDAESEALGKRVKQVSIQINPKFKDGKGNDYGEAIEHVAVTPEPIVPGQQDFEKLAFALSIGDPPQGAAGQGVLYLQRDTHSSKGALSMAKKPGEEEDDGEGECKTCGKAFSLAKEHLSKHLGADHEDVKALKPDNAMTYMCKHFSNLQDAHKTLNAAHVASAKLAASREVPPAALSMIAKASEVTLDAVQAKGCITPKVCASLKELLVGKVGARNVMALSLDEGTEENLVGRVAKILDENSPVELGERTKSQALSREVPGATVDPEQEKVDKAFEARRKERLGVK